MPYIFKVKSSCFFPRKIIRGQSIEIQPRKFFDLNDLKNSFSYYFENSSLKSTHFFRGLMWDINLFRASKLIQIYLPDICDEQFTSC